MQLTKLAKEGKLRDNVKITLLWPPVLTELKKNAVAFAKTAPIFPALDLLLMLEATNAGVERDAGLCICLFDSLLTDELLVRLSVNRFVYLLACLNSCLFESVSFWFTPCPTDHIT